MKKYYIIACVVLWLIVIIGSEIFLSGSGKLTSLAPLYFICMIGSIMIVSKAYDAGKR